MQGCRRLFCPWRTAQVAELGVSKFVRAAFQLWKQYMEIMHQKCCFPGSPKGGQLALAGSSRQQTTAEFVGSAGRGISGRPGGGIECLEAWLASFIG